MRQPSINASRGLSRFLPPHMYVHTDIYTVPCTLSLVSPNLQIFPTHNPCRMIPAPSYIINIIYNSSVQTEKLSVTVSCIQRITLCYIVGVKGII